MDLSLLLAAPAVTNALTNTVNVIAKKETLAGWVAQGGIMMVPIVIASLVAVAIIIERFVYLRRVRIDAGTFMERIRRVLAVGQVNEALVICENTPGPIAGLVKAGIEQHGRTREEIREAIEDCANREMPRLERFLPALGTIANVSPLLGLLGTVLGMIKSSNVLATEGTANTLGLIGGISEALISTAAGLFVAIPVLLFYNYFINRVNTMILDMELRSTELVAIMTGRDGGAAALREGGSRQGRVGKI